MRTDLGTVGADIMIRGYDSDDGMFLLVLQFELERLGAFAIVCIWLACLLLKKDGNRYPCMTCHKSTVL